VPSHKDIVLAILGAGTGFAGLVLVFLGILVSSFESYDREGKTAAQPKFEPAAWGSVGAFCLGLASVILALSWLLASPNDGLFVPVVVVFLFEVATVGIMAIWFVKKEFRGA
jgi:uncharacterized membrane protein